MLLFGSIVCFLVLGKFLLLPKRGIEVYEY